MPKPGGEERDRQPRVGVEPVQRRDGVEVGDEGDLERDHQRGQAEHEERALEREGQEGEGVGGQHGRDQLADHDDRRHDRRRRHVLRHLPAVPGRAVVVPLRVGREERGRLVDQLVRREQRVHDRDVDREEDDDGAGRQQGVAADGAQPAPRLAARTGLGRGRGRPPSGSGASSTSAGIGHPPFQEAHLQNRSSTSRIRKRTVAMMAAAPALFSTCSVLMML